MLCNQSQVEFKFWSRQSICYTTAVMSTALFLVRIWKTGKKVGLT
jgi:hypothetical protein